MKKKMIKVNTDTGRFGGGKSDKKPKAIRKEIPISPPDKEEPPDMSFGEAIALIGKAGKPKGP